VIYIQGIYVCVCVKPKYKNKQLFYVISSVSYQTETITDVITLADATLKKKYVIIQSYPFHTLIQNLIYWQL
jgi:hypothetical protein